MKCYTQAYVRGSIEAADMYCKAFGAEITFQIRDEKGAYAHCELSVNGNGILALSEAPDDCDTSKKEVWQTMAFNAFELGSKEAVQRAFNILSEGGKVLKPLGPVSWSEFCADVIDKYGVFWWIAI